jgi:replicative DNA helicase
MLDVKQNQIVHKSPPLNLEAEQALLGALLHNNTSLERVSEFLQPAHFADAKNGKIYKATCTLIESNQVADPITLKEYFTKDNTLAEVGGVEYLITLADAAISIVNVHHYGELIYDLYLRRKLIHIGESVVNQAHLPVLESSSTQQIVEAEKLLFDLGSTGEGGLGFQSFNTSLTQAIKMAEIAYKRDSHVVGITTGFKDLDRWLGGLHATFKFEVQHDINFC